MRADLKIVVINIEMFQKYYVIFKLLRNYWMVITHFQSLSKY